MIVADTSFVFALVDARDSRHQAASNWFERAGDELVTTPLIVAELDYLISSHVGAYARDRFREQLATGALGVQWWSQAIDETVETATRFRELGVSLADASLVALASRLGQVAVATFDERHFRVLKPAGGAQAFTLMPTDASGPRL